MQASRIRPIAICVCRDAGRILVAELQDTHRGRTFFRPLGGTIEFGERGEDAVRREFQEEIGTDLTEVRYLGTLENIFLYEGRRGHEIVLVYDGQLADESLYTREEIEGFEIDIHEPFRVVWKPLDEFGPDRPPVYPDGLLDLLAREP
ncbi:MAG: NUDIX domain-containing protein [Anaerolineales bacterium]|nr:NUDIX domain-containing protein [Anaerolineales bacterium]